ncbi:hypothetical protein YC2023_067737 [Brassica napus]
MDKFIVKETHEKEKNDEINIGDSCNVNIGESSSHEKNNNIDNTQVLNTFKILEKENVGAASFLDIYDPRNWNMLDEKNERNISSRWTKKRFVNCKRS